MTMITPGMTRSRTIIRMIETVLKKKAFYRQAVFI